MLLAVLAAAGFTVWAGSAAPAEPGPLADAERTPGVSVHSTDEGVEIAPAGDRAAAGVVFYPGGRVEPAAYAAAWAPVVERAGVRVIIPAMPLNLAFFASDRAADVIAGAAGATERWYVGGHSLGGAMAASYAGGRPPGELEGLILWGSYATEDADLAGRSDLRVLSVSGSRDGLTDPATAERNRSHLPPDAAATEIAGMSHAQFGAYGPQDGDGTPRLTGPEARRALADTTAGFLAAPASR